ncbi:hypothetical protein K491DRAFT_777568 [Lophiostoma macrostomum CBS 122681]|uniref:Uncharacterized protein n=1 Tax=Lophiostoma macrostomum CBS 122681 TaxID=1314788 RepID=A0A6A6TAJ7_9PLEO|nr:hypothetical protein K491DRAFT_777568 [Lophiostoma macrostomum CBS 122681]
MHNDAIRVAKDIENQEWASEDFFPLILPKEERPESEQMMLRLRCYIHRYFREQPEKLTAAATKRTEEQAREMSDWIRWMERLYKVKCSEEPAGPKASGEPVREGKDE